VFDENSSETLNDHSDRVAFALVCRMSESTTLYRLIAIQCPGSRVCEHHPSHHGIDEV
jgi:hypothetical protein